MTHSNQTQTRNEFVQQGSENENRIERPRAHISLFYVRHFHCSVYVVGYLLHVTLNKTKSMINEVETIMRSFKISNATELDVSIAFHFVANKRIQNKNLSNKIYNIGTMHLKGS